MRVVYADELFLENFIIDYILLIVTARVTGIWIKRIRAVLGAGIGGVYALVSVITGMDFMTLAVIKILIGLLMVYSTFGGGRRYIKLCLIFLALSAAFAGALVAVLSFTGGTAFGNITFGVMAVSFGVSYLIFSIVFKELGRHRVSGGIAAIVIEHQGHRAKLSALIDSGNSLSDPITGMPITICALESLQRIFDNKTLNILRYVHDPAQAMAEISRLRNGTYFRLVPYRALGVNDGILLVFRPDRITRDGITIKNGLVAIARQDMASGDGYSALTNAG